MTDKRLPGGVVRGLKRITRGKKQSRAWPRGSVNQCQPVSVPLGRKPWSQGPWEAIPKGNSKDGNTATAMALPLGEARGGIRTHTDTHTDTWMEAVHKDRPAETAANWKPAFSLHVRK